MNWNESLPLVTSIALIIVSIYVFKESVRKRNIETITVNRLEWLRSVRGILTEFAIIYKVYPERNHELREFEIKLLMYTRWDKKSHEEILNQVKCCCVESYNEKDYEKLILLSQCELTKAWHRVLAESQLNMKSGGKYESKMLKRLNEETKGLSDMVDRVN